MAVAVGDPHYIEHVSINVAGTKAMLEGMHGWTFDAPDPVLGGSIVARLPGGGLCSVRGPLRADEAPATRVYVRVASLDQVVERARKAGAAIALDRMELGKHGAIGIFLLGGIEHGVWELPRAAMTRGP